MPGAAWGEIRPLMQETVAIDQYARERHAGMVAFFRPKSSHAAKNASHPAKMRKPRKEEPRPAATIAPLLMPAQSSSALISDKRHQPGEGPHIDPLEQRPFPTIRFAPNDGHRADALQGEHIE